MIDERDWSDSRNVIPWWVERRSNVQDHLQREGIRVSVPLRPAYFVAPILSLWCCRPNVWVIAGDVPTDHCDAPLNAAPRDVLRIFALRWQRVSANMLEGRRDPELDIGDPENREQQRELGDLLQRRARFLANFVEDESNW